jgi:hypothetical protein
MYGEKLSHGRRRVDIGKLSVGREKLHPLKKLIVLSPRENVLSADSRRQSTTTTEEEGS